MTGLSSANNLRCLKVLLASFCDSLVEYVDIHHACRLRVQGVVAWHAVYRTHASSSVTR